MAAYTPLLAPGVLGSTWRLDPGTRTDCVPASGLAVETIAVPGFRLNGNPARSPTDGADQPPCPES